MKGDRQMSEVYSYERYAKAMRMLERHQSIIERQEIELQSLRLLVGKGADNLLNATEYVDTSKLI